MLEHGGKVRAAAKLYEIPEHQWIDLSTGINPHGWPVPPIPPDVWRALPESDDQLIESARTYYGSKHLLPTAGSQAAIQVLPSLRPRSRVGVLSLTYNEHRHAWLRQGHLVAPVAPDEVESALDQLDVLVICNPNNTTGDRFSIDKLLRWHNRLSQRDGWLIVDEAFMDPTPELSLIGQASKPGLIVLRSLGKFFGMGGARVGFVASDGELLSRLEQELGPWTIGGPSRWAATLALKDKLWHGRTTIRLRAESLRLCKLLTETGFPPAGGTVFFQWVLGEHSARLHAFLAKRAILTRHFSEPQSLRFGLPDSEESWQRLHDGLNSFAALPEHTEV